MDRNKSKDTEPDEFERLKTTFNTVKDDPEARERFIASLSEAKKTALSSIADFAESAAGTASDALETLTKEDLTVEKIDELAAQGTDVLAEAIDKAKYLSVFGGPTAIAATFLADGALGIFNKLNGKDDKSKENTFNLMSAFMSDDESGVGDFISSKVSELTNGLSMFKKMASNFGGDIGNQISGFIEIALSAISSFMPNIKGMVSQLMGGGDDQPSTEEQDTLLAQQQEQTRQADLVRKAAIEANGPSPETTRDEFARVHDNVPSTKELPDEVPIHVLNKNPEIIV